MFGETVGVKPDGSGFRENGKPVSEVRGKRLLPQAWLGEGKNNNKDSNGFFQKDTQVRTCLDAERKEPVKKEEGREQNS